MAFVAKGLSPCGSLQVCYRVALSERRAYKEMEMSINRLLTLGFRNWLWVKKRYPNMEPWEMETWTQTCGPLVV